MELTETKPVLESISVTPSMEIQVTNRITIQRGNEDVTTIQDRALFKPGDDLTGQDERVIAIAKSLWTPEYMAKLNTEKLFDYRYMESMVINDANEIQATIVKVTYRNNAEVFKESEPITIKPGDDLTDLQNLCADSYCVTCGTKQEQPDQPVLAVAQAVHTPEVVAAYQAQANMGKTRV